MRSYFNTIGRINPLDALGLPAFLPRLTRWRARSALRFFDGAVDAIIAERRRLLAEAPDEVPRDILTLLLESRDPQSGAALSEAELRADIVTLIAAGHETTANPLTWSLYRLRQPDACWNRPNLFDPKRFLGASCKPAHRHAYLPFGAGPRICLATIVKSLDLRLVAGAEVQPLLRITLRPKGGLPMVLRRRG
jgi:cytochrome P450